MLLRERYPDFGPTLAAEKLAENLGLKVSRKTLRKWMIAGGIWLSRKQRRRFNQPRLRQEWLIQPSQRHYFAKGCEGFTSWSVAGVRTRAESFSGPLPHDELDCLTRCYASGLVGGVVRS